MIITMRLLLLAALLLGTSLASNCSSGEYLEPNLLLCLVCPPNCIACCD